MAKLYFRYSTMGAGKTLDLLKVTYNYEEKGKKVLLFTSDLDDRYGVGKIVSRTGIQRDAMLFGKDYDIYNCVKNYAYHYGHLDCVLVDEAQFLTKDNVKQLTNIVDELDIPVICYGLRSDFQGELFEGSYYLFVFSDKLEEVQTICHCGKKGTMLLRIRDGKVVCEGEKIQIGGSESYVPVCRKHFKEGKISSY